MYQAEVNLSETVTVDAACYYDHLTKNQCCFTAYGLHTCVLTTARSRERATIEELDDVIHLGCNAADQGDLTVYKIAKILGKQFKAGEWGKWDTMPRCGSVVTCVINGRSLYARVLRFLKSDVAGDSCPGYASVRWFSEPTYDNCLCPKVTLDGADIEREVGVNVVRIKQSQVSVERVGDGSFYMIRDSGVPVVKQIYSYIIYLIDYIFRINLFNVVELYRKLIHSVT